MSNLGRIHPKYVTLSLVNDGTNGSETVDAVIDQYYNSDIIDKCSNYVCAVERLEISLNAIPFYDNEQPSLEGVEEKIEIYSLALADDNTVVTGSLQMQWKAYSLQNLFDTIYNVNIPLGMDLASQSLLGYTIRLKLSIDSTGYIFIEIETVGQPDGGGGLNFHDIRIKFPAYLNYIFGFSERQQDFANFNNQNYMQSYFPRFDLGDDLNHIVIVTNLPTISDQVGTAIQLCLTDFAPQTVYDTSLSYNNGRLINNGVTLNTRQRAIYNPNERRYLDMISNIALRSLLVKAYYVNAFGENKIIKLPIGGTFNIKLGFYNK